MSPTIDILVVEDSQTQAAKLHYLLKDNNYRVFIANNGKEALDILESRKVHLVISDVMMPVMNGYDLCKAIKSKNELKDIPVILLTTLDNLVDVLRGLSVGADNYLSKPFKDDYILHRIQQVLDDKMHLNKSSDSNHIHLSLGQEDFHIDADPKKILNFFISSYEASIQVNRSLQKTSIQLEELNANLEKIVKERTLELEIEIDSHRDTLEELKLALEKATQIDKLKTEFMHNLSHEIRTPMNAIFGFSDLINEPDISDIEVKEVLPHITESLEVLLSLINNIVEASEIASGTVNLERTTCVPEKMLKDGILAANYQEDSIEFEVIIEESIQNLKYDTYTPQIHIVIDKILSNAFKFTNQGKVTLKISDTTDSFLTFEITDTGIGIPDDRKLEIFECFKQLEDIHTTKYQGTGMGLYIAMNLVYLMGGRIWFESELGVGSSFYFTVPYFNEPKVQSDRSFVDKKRKKRTNADQIRLLLAEDVATNYYLVKKLAEKLGITLLWAKNGLEAITYYDKYHASIDLVLMDIQMPEMDGIQATKHIKEKYPDAIIIALTAYAEEVFEGGIQENGFRDLIRKPVRPTKLLDIMKKELNITSNYE